jgi:hypothetical protein
VQILPYRFDIGMLDPCLPDPGGIRQLRACRLRDHPVQVFLYCPSVKLNPEGWFACLNIAFSAPAKARHLQKSIENDQYLVRNRSLLEMVFDSPCSRNCAIVEPAYLTLCLRPLIKS